MRKVMVSRRDRKDNYELKEVGKAVFHQFGMDYEEFEAGPGNFSVAIVEWPDGKVEFVRADWIRFIE